MKTWAVAAVFPQAKAKAAVQHISVEASSLSTAVARGIREILKRPGIKGCRHKVVKLTVVQEVSHGNGSDV